MQYDRPTDVRKLIKTLESQSRGWGTDTEKRRAAKDAMLLIQSLIDVQYDRHVAAYYAYLFWRECIMVTA